MDFKKWGAQAWEPYISLRLWYKVDIVIAFLVVLTEKFRLLNLLVYSSLEPVVVVVVDVITVVVVVVTVVVGNVK